MRTTVKQYTPRIKELLLQFEHDEGMLEKIIKDEFGMNAASKLQWSHTNKCLSIKRGFGQSNQIPLFDYIVEFGNSIDTVTELQLYSLYNTREVTIIPDLRIKVNLSRNAPMLQKKDNSGYDLHCMTENESGEPLSYIAIDVGQTEIIPTGISVEIPHGYALQIIPSLNAAKIGLHVHLRIIDSSDKGEIMIIVTNQSRTLIKIDRLDVVAHAVLCKTYDADIKLVSNSATI